MGSRDQNLELFLQEIEGVDDYWGPTFRAIYESDNSLTFMEELEKRINHHDNEIERMCNTYYQGFIDSIRDLQLVRNQAKNLNKKVLDIGSAIELSSKQFDSKWNTLMEARRVESNISAAMKTLTTCLPVFVTYSKLQKQICDKRYYPALKTLEQLEHSYLPCVSKLKFFHQVIESIPQIRENMKEVSMSDLKDFLENIRRLSLKIGEVAIRHTAEQLKSDSGALDTSQLKKGHGNGEIQINNFVVGSNIDEDISAQHLIDFSPIYRSLHIYSVLGVRDVFENYYRTQREKQARLVVQPYFGNSPSIQDFQTYLRSVTGFFVQEDHILNTSNGLINRSYMDNLWSSCATKIVSIFRIHTTRNMDANFLLRLKNVIMLFSATLKNYEYSVDVILQFLCELKNHYNEVLMLRWAEIFGEILEEENFLQIEVFSVEEYEDVIKKFPFKDESLEVMEFPRKFPFSAMVPKVYKQVKEFIYASLKFTEDLHMNPSSLKEMMKNSTTSLLSKTFSSCLSNLFHRANLTLLQITQIIVDTSFLEKSSLYLEEFVSNIVGLNVGMELLAANDTNLFKVARDDAEKQICDKLKNKIDEFLELENYDWMLVEPQGHASSFITDLIAFLRITFESFTNLPPEVAQKVCHTACQHIAKSLMDFITTDHVKSMSLGAIQQINLDTIQCEQFAASEPVPGLEEGTLLLYFSDLRQLLDLLMSGDWSVYFHEYGRENSKYKRVLPITAIIILEKLSANQKGVFSNLKKVERDRQKLLVTVLKHLRQLASIHNDKMNQKTD